MRKKIKNVTVFVVLLLSAIMIVVSIYYHKEYPKQDFEQILFYILNGAEHTAPSVVNDVILKCGIPIIILFAVLYLLTIENVKKKLSIKLKKRNFQIYPIKLIANHKAIYTIIVFCIALCMVIVNFKVIEYIKNISQETKIFDEKYINPQTVEIEFPEQKRNLIIIIAESMENSLLSKENGGAWEKALIPELENLAVQNTNFSNNDKIGGAYETYGTNYSAAGIVAITAGIPLKTAELLEDRSLYNGNGKYLAGAYSLGEILKSEGYNLEVMMGSDGNFGGRTQYFTTNGGYKIFDVNYAIQIGKMTESQRVWWGFEDDKLFEWSKEEITNLAKQEKPFNYIMVTADTHFVDGYLSEKAEKKYASQYENVYAYSSKSISEFIKWVQKQKFYKNTTIVIVGDHLGMQSEFYEEKTKKESPRTIYNVIINPAIEATNTQNREFSTVDLYPTILASIGVSIEGDRLGIGTNLYSGLPTLIEQYGYDYFNKEIGKRSSFYNKNILGDDYFVMKKETQKGEENKNNEGNNEESNTVI